MTEEEAVAKALSLMIEHDFSQLPVIKKEDNFEIPKGMITYDGILRGIRNFKAKIEDLKVRDVMVAALIYSLEDDLFDILDRLKETNAVLVIDGRIPVPELVGIVTSCAIASNCAALRAVYGWLQVRVSSAKLI